MRMVMPRWRVSGPAGLFCICTAIALLTACPTQAAGAPAKTDSQVKAAGILKTMSQYLAGLTSFSCKSSNSFEVVQKNGQKIEFGETRQISLARPNHLRIEEVSSDGTNDLALFDGKQITVLSADDKLYAQAPQPASLEDALVYFVRDLHMRMPLALMLSNHVGTELPALAKQVDYVESTKISGQAAHHIAGRGDSVDFQIWIADGSRPLPLRIVITYKLAPGQPKFSADISDWIVSPSFTDKTFQLSLPKDARSIPFAVQLTTLAAPQPAASGAVKP
jgi:hypothetical protein